MAHPHLVPLDTDYHDAPNAFYDVLWQSMNLTLCRGMDTCKRDGHPLQKYLHLEKERHDPSDEGWLLWKIFRSGMTGERRTILKKQFKSEEKALVMLMIKLLEHELAEECRWINLLSFAFSRSANALKKIKKPQKDVSARHKQCYTPFHELLFTTAKWRLEDWPRHRNPIDDPMYKYFRLSKERRDGWFRLDVFRFSERILYAQFEENSLSFEEEALRRRLVGHFFDIHGTEGGKLHELQRAYGISHHTLWSSAITNMSPSPERINTYVPRVTPDSQIPANKSTPSMFTFEPKVDSPLEVQEPQSTTPVALSCHEVAPLPRSFYEAFLQSIRSQSQSNLDHCSGDGSGLYRYLLQQNERRQKGWLRLDLFKTNRCLDNCDPLNSHLSGEEKALLIAVKTVLSNFNGNNVKWADVLAESYGKTPKTVKQLKAPQKETTDKPFFHDVLRQAISWRMTPSCVETEEEGDPLLEYFASAQNTESGWFLRKVFNLDCSSPSTLTKELRSLQRVVSDLFCDTDESESRWLHLLASAFGHSDCVKSQTSPEPPSVIKTPNSLYQAIVEEIEYKLENPLGRKSPEENVLHQYLSYKNGQSGEGWLRLEIFKCGSNVSKSVLLKKHLLPEEKALALLLKSILSEAGRKITCVAELLAQSFGRTANSTNFIQLTDKDRKDGALFHEVLQDAIKYRNEQSTSSVHKKDPLYQYFFAMKDGQRGWLLRHVFQHENFKFPDELTHQHQCLQKLLSCLFQKAPRTQDGWLALLARAYGHVDTELPCREFKMPTYWYEALIQSLIIQEETDCSRYKTLESNPIFAYLASKNTAHNSKGWLLIDLFRSSIDLPKEILLSKQLSSEEKELMILVYDLLWDFCPQEEKWINELENAFGRTAKAIKYVKDQESKHSCKSGDKVLFHEMLPKAVQRRKQLSQNLSTSNDPLYTYLLTNRTKEGGWLLLDTFEYKSRQLDTSQPHVEHRSLRKELVGLLADECNEEPGGMHLVANAFECTLTDEDNALQDQEPPESFYEAVALSLEMLSKSHSLQRRHDECPLFQYLSKENLQHNEVGWLRFELFKVGSRLSHTKLAKQYFSPEELSLFHLLIDIFSNWCSKENDRWAELLAKAFGRTTRYIYQQKTSNARVSSEQSKSSGTLFHEAFRAAIQWREKTQSEHRVPHDDPLYKYLLSSETKSYGWFLRDTFGCNVHQAKQDVEFHQLNCLRQIMLKHLADVFQGDSAWLDEMAKAFGRFSWSKSGNAATFLIQQLEVMAKNPCYCDKWWTPTQLSKLVNLELSSDDSQGCRGEDIAKALTIKRPRKEGQRLSKSCPIDVHIHRMDDGEKLNQNFICFTNRGETSPPNLALDAMTQTTLPSQKVCTFSATDRKRFLLDIASLRAQSHHRRDSGFPSSPREGESSGLIASKLLFGSAEEHKRVKMRLESVLSKKKTWCEVVIGAKDKELAQLIQANDMEDIMHTLILLRSAVQTLHNNADGRTWREICQQTVEQYQLGCVKSGKVLEKRFRMFRQHKWNIPHPRKYIDEDGNNTKVETYTLLDEHNDLKLAFDKHAHQNLRGLSVDKMHNYANTYIVPALKREIWEAAQKERECSIDDDEFDDPYDCGESTPPGDSSSTSNGYAKSKPLDIPEADQEWVEKKLYEQYKLKNGMVSRTTVWRWMKALGMRYEATKKDYYVDKHEDPKVRLYRRDFIRRRLAAERRQYMWYQVPLTTIRELQEEKMLPNDEIGYHYKDQTSGEDMVELHIDACTAFLDEVNEIEFGGHLSVRMKPCERPLILFGQDEVACKQHQFQALSWVMADGERALRPKSEGDSLMISGFVSRPFGFGLRPSKEVLEKVNKAREGKEYFDETAALDVNKSINKPNLTSDPAVRRFEFGKGNGYWTGNHTILQTEDCIDTLGIMHPCVQAGFTFDHSSGHCKSREGALNVDRMNKTWGGGQDWLHESVLNESCLGPHSPQLKPGDTQEFVFKSSDDGPFYESDEVKARKNDVYLPGRAKRKLTVKDLTEALIADGVSPTDLKRKLKGDLQAMSEARGLPSVEVNEQKMLQTWVGKQKGMLQVAYERGLIDPAKGWQAYQVDSPKDTLGNKDETLSLKEQLGRCHDFANEKSQLQHVVEALDSVLDMSPKCHPEIAGEGIEYLWGFMKRLYRKQWSCRPEDQQKKKHFRELLEKNLDGTDTGPLNKFRVRKMAAHARRYMLSYAKLEGDKNHSEILEGKGLPQDQIERVAKEFKCHRSAMDFAGGFLSRLEEEGRH